MRKFLSSSYRGSGWPSPGMLARCAVALIFLAPALPATAQVNPAEWSTPNVMVEGMRNGSRPRKEPARDSEASARRTCSKLPMFQAKLGRYDPKIMRLRSLCTRAGYRH